MLICSLRKRKKAGLSLVELLISISIFSIVALTLFSTFSNGIRLSKQADRTQLFYRGVRFSFDTIARDLENMVPYQLPKNNDTKIHKVIVQGATFEQDDELKMGFSGDEKSLSLLLPTSEGLKLVRYYLSSEEKEIVHEVQIRHHTLKNVEVYAENETERDIVSFIREEVALTNEIISKEALHSNKEILSDRIEKDSLVFKYYHAKGDQGEWMPAWQQEGFPSAVQLEMVFRDLEDETVKQLFSKKLLVPLSGK